MDLNIQHFDVIDSTNSEACRQIDDAISKLDGNTKSNINTNLDGQTGAEPLKNLHKKIIVADSQTAGKGRLNRSFYSPKSTGIYMSLIWILDTDDFNPALYTATAAVCVTRAIKSVYNIDTKIKWVNDVYLDDKKICGILAEGKINPKTGKITAIVVGIGVNIATPEGDFPEEMKDKAGALGVDFGGSKLIRTIAQNVFQIYGDKSSFQIVMNEYREKSNLIGKIVTVSPVINQSESSYQAEVIDITQNAELKVKLLDGEICKLSSGEVSLHFN